MATRLPIASLASLLLPFIAEAQITELQRLTSSGRTSGDKFGQSVAVSENLVVVGAPERAEHGAFAGAAYLFEAIPESDPPRWQEVTQLFGSGSGPGSKFGTGVAIIDDDTVAVGASAEHAVPAPGSQHGVIYIFSRDHGGPDTWGETARIHATEPTTRSGFGSALAADGDILAVAADGISTVYLFLRDPANPTGWTGSKSLSTPAELGFTNFGYSLDLDNDTLVVGAPYEASRAGAAYLFDRHAGGQDNWGQTGKLLPLLDPGAVSAGWSVATDGQLAVMGATSADGDDPSRGNTGAAYLFQRDSGGTDNWGFARKLFANNGILDRSIGTATAISGNRVLVGADDSRINAPQEGATYLYSTTPCPSDNPNFPLTPISGSMVVQGSHFGEAIATHGDLAVIGAPIEGGFHPDGIAGGAVYLYRIADPLPSFQPWLDSHSLTTGDHLADPDHDRLPLLVEFACNLSPATPDHHTLLPGTGTAGLPHTSLVATGPAPVLRTEYLQRSGEPDLCYLLESSTSAGSGTWSPLTGTTTVTPIDASWQRVVTESPLDPTSAPTTLVRLRLHVR